MNRKVRVAAIVAVALGLIGAGVGASFTDQGVARQQVTIGDFGIVLTSSNGVVNPDGSVTCTYAIEDSWGGQLPCNVAISQAPGSIPVNQLNVHMQTAVTGTPELTQFGVEVAGLDLINPPSQTIPYWPLSTSDVWLGNVLNLPRSMDFTLDYGQMAGGGGLNNASLNSSIIVTYTFEAYA